MKHVVDAHAVIWFLERNVRLGPNMRQVLLDPVSELVPPATSLAEACWIVDRGRTSLPSSAVLLAAVDADPRLSVFALDRAVIERTTLPDLAVIAEMHDRQIVATALLLAASGEPAARLTHDGNITASGLVPVVW